MRAFGAFCGSFLVSGLALAQGAVPPGTPPPPPGWVLAPTQPTAPPPAAPTAAPTAPPPATYAPAPAQPGSAPAYPPGYQGPPAGPPSAAASARPGDGALFPSSGATEEYRPLHYDAFVKRPLVVEGHASAGGPYGWIGAALDYSLIRTFSVGGGAGLGQEGLQIAAMARYRVVFDGLSVGFGLGGSGGPYESGIFSNERYRWTVAYWLNTEGFFEWRSRGGLMVRGYVGSGAGLNPGSSKCSARYRDYYSGCDLSQQTDPDPMFVGYIGSAIGYAFGK